MVIRDRKLSVHDKPTTTFTGRTPKNVTTLGNYGKIGHQISHNEHLEKPPRNLHAPPEFRVPRVGDSCAEGL